MRERERVVTGLPILVHVGHRARGQSRHVGADELRYVVWAVGHPDAGGAVDYREHTLSDLLPEVLDQLGRGECWVLGLHPRRDCRVNVEAMHAAISVMRPVERALLANPDLVAAQVDELVVKHAGHLLEEREEEDVGAVASHVEDVAA